MKRAFTLTAVVFCALALVVGCGQKHIKTEGVTGTITLDGTPQQNVNVYFVPESEGGSPSYAMTDENGHYKLQTLAGAANAGTTPGTYLVKFDYQIKKEDGTMEENGEIVTRYTSVPGLAKKWTNEKTSGVQVEVKPGDNVFDFEITSN
ncbi:MAG: hypothetical protein ACOX0A_10150 [Thermoguttaceae bacterium]|jgi:hypothetical protein